MTKSTFEQELEGRERINDKWANDFKIIGNGDNETPRYSQLMKLDDYDSDSPYVLKSTQKRLFYELGLTEEEQFELTNMDANERWKAWKEIRTAHLLEHHNTIHPY